MFPAGVLTIVKQERGGLSYWLTKESAAGTIEQCIREAGVPCYPVVEEPMEELQEEKIVNLDETIWYEKGFLKWLMEVFGQPFPEMSNSISQPAWPGC